MASGKPQFPESSWGISKRAPHFPARAGSRKVLKEGFPDRSKIIHFRVMYLDKEFSLFISVFITVKLKLTVGYYATVKKGVL